MKGTLGDREISEGDRKALYLLFLFFFFVSSSSSSSFKTNEVLAGWLQCI
jgi:hypothetical protein